MKCITYVSKFVVSHTGAMIPSGLSDIYNVARVKNSEFNITGVISYKQGHYIQVIEGDDEAVHQLLENIKKDRRHREVTILFDFPISERSFANSAMRMLPSVKDDPDFLKFAGTNTEAISELNESELEMFEFFYNPRATPISLVKSFVGSQLMLTAWPDFTVVVPSASIVDLCAKLTQGTYSYDALLLEGEHSSDEVELNNTLVTFSKLGILKVIEAEKTEEQEAEEAKIEIEPPVISTEEAAAPSGFYMKMKSFLGFGK